MKSLRKQKMTTEPGKKPTVAVVPTGEEFSGNVC